MKVVIIGQGGHSKVIQDIVESMVGTEIIGYFDDKYNYGYVTQGLYYGPVLASKRLLDWYEDIKFMIAIGDNRVRKAIVEKLNLLDEDYAVLIHPSAVISPSVKLGNGSVVMANVVVNADAEIRKHTIINSGAVIEHDVKVGDYTHVSPNATLTGGVTVEEGVHIGAGATLIPQVSIGKWTMIGAGATVISDIPNHCTAVGIPAKVRRKHYQEVD